MVAVLHAAAVKNHPTARTALAAWKKTIDCDAASRAVRSLTEDDVVNVYRDIMAQWPSLKDAA